MTQQRKRQWSLRLMANIIANLLLLPVYSVLFILCTIIAVSPLFPARTARENFKKRLQLTPVGVILATSATLFHYLILLFEDFIFWPLGLMNVKDNPNVRKHFIQASFQAKKKSAGIVILSGHFGNIEFASQCIADLLSEQISPQSPLIALAKPSRSDWMTQLLLWYRNRRGLDVLLTHRKDLVKAILMALKQQRALALLIDQKPATGGRFFNFFGTPSAFPDGGIEIALRAKADFVFFASRRIWPGFLTVEGLVYECSEQEKNDVNRLLTAFVQWLESLIRLSPWQWCWDYRKWSRQPPKDIV
jgi:lauroyl/myristoyl acyltransferase